jgi:hypothetical protein
VRHAPAIHHPTAVIAALDPAIHHPTAVIAGLDPAIHFKPKLSDSCSEKPYLSDSFSQNRSIQVEVD